MADNEDSHKHEHVDTDDEHQPETVEEQAEEKAETKAEPKSKFTKHKDWWAWAMGHKKISLPVAAAVLVLLLAVVPFTRYALAGLVLKQDLQVTVVDSQTESPVSAATVTLHGKTVLTNNQGKATLHVAVGSGQLTVAKKYYKTAMEGVTVTISKPAPVQVKVTATGRQVPVTVLNAISGKPLENATVTADGSQFKTDNQGQVMVVLPANKTTVKATVGAGGYNTADATIKVTAKVDPANTFKITPAGKIYFLSNASGKIDVVKTNLDGSDRQVVLAGTGKEDSNATALLASRDWKWLALLSKRDGGDDPKLFLIDTSSDEVTTMDEGKANFALDGWSNDNFIYTVTRYDHKDWQAKAQALKAFNASTKKLTIIDETDGTGTGDYDYYRQAFGTVFIFGDTLVYTKNTAGYGGSVLGTRPALIISTTVGGTKKVLKSFTASVLTYYNGYVSLNIDAALYEPGALYFKFNPYGWYGFLTPGAKTDVTVYAYEDGKVTAQSGKTDIYGENGYPTYLVSPNGEKSFWGEPRDGRNVLFVGDANGQNGKQVLDLDGDQTYGWFTDDYVLVSKNGSELYILPVTGGNPLKVTNYYRAGLSYPGYGYGYGGL